MRRAVHGKSCNFNEVGDSLPTTHAYFGTTGLRIMQPTERERTAHHEAAHAVAGRLLRPDARVLDVTNRPIEGTLGHVGLELSKAELDCEPGAIQNLCTVLLAGRAAETELLGVPPESTEQGAADDEAAVQNFLSLLGLGGEEGAMERARLYEEARRLVIREREQISKQAQALMDAG